MSKESETKALTCAPHVYDSIRTARAGGATLPITATQFNVALLDVSAAAARATRRQSP